MGWFFSLVTGVLDREQDRFIQQTEVLQFDDEVYVSWSRPVSNLLPPGWVEKANGTLRVLYQLAKPRKKVDYEMNPVYGEVTPNLFGYVAQFKLNDSSALFHLVLPPKHLSTLESIKPFPTYALSQNERFVIGWIWKPSIQFSFTFFEEVSLDAFNFKAAKLVQAVINGQTLAIESEKQLTSIKTQLHTWYGNLRFLEEQKAQYGLNVPLFLHNEIENANIQIDNLESRRQELQITQW